MNKRGPNQDQMWHCDRCDRKTVHETALPHHGRLDGVSLRAYGYTENIGSAKSVLARIRRRENLRATSPRLS